MAKQETFTTSTSRREYTEAFNGALGMLAGADAMGMMPPGGLDFVVALLRGLNHPRATRLSVIVTTPEGTFETVAIDVT